MGESRDIVYLGNMAVKEVRRFVFTVGSNSTLTFGETGRSPLEGITVAILATGPNDDRAAGFVPMSGTTPKPVSISAEPRRYGPEIPRRALR